MLSAVTGTAPTLITPGATTVDTSPEFRWQPVDGASAYEFSLYDVARGALIASANGLKGQSHTPATTLGAGRAYQAFVRPVGAEGNPGLWGRLDFSVVHKATPSPAGNAVPGGTTVTGPVGTTAESSPTIRWTAADRAESYELYVYSITQGRELIHERGLTQTEFAPVSPLGNDRYQVFVVAHNSAGAGLISQPFEFRVDAPQFPSVDSSLTPPVWQRTATSNSQGDGDLSWQPVNGAVGYDIQLYDVAAGQLLESTQVTSTTTFTPGQPLVDGRVHQAFVRAVNSAGRTSQWTGLEFTPTRTPAVSTDSAIAGVTIDLSFGELKVQGTQSPERITLDRVTDPVTGAEQIRVTVQGALLINPDTRLPILQLTGTQSVATGDTSKFFDASLVDAVSIDAGAGNDRVDLARLGNIYAETFGRDGNDTIIGGDGFDFIFGGAGDDEISTGGGPNDAYGDAGNDTIYGGSGTDQLSGDQGNDFIVGAGGNDTIYGNDGFDTLHGGGGNDFISGGAGGDTIRGRNGEDTLTGGDGNDLIEGEGQNDVIRGGAGNDTLNGGSGNDILYGEDGDDLLDGNLGHDALSGGRGNDRLFGWLGDDSLRGDGGSDRFLVSRIAGSTDVVIDADSYFDAVIEFQNGDRSWSRGDILAVDSTLGLLVRRTNNTTLLKLRGQCNLGIAGYSCSHRNPLVFLRHSAAETNADNIAADNNDAGRIRFFDNAFSSREWLHLNVLHELAHNWDNENPMWPEFLRISHWIRGPVLFNVIPGHNRVDVHGTPWFYLSTATFAREYGRSGPQEDFATSFAAALTPLSNDDYARHQEALDEIAQLCRQENWQLATWNVSTGMTVSGAAGDENAGADPLAAIRAVSALATPDGTTLMVLQNFHRFLQSPEIVQAVAQQIIAGKQNRTILVVLAQLVKLPDELQKQFVVVEHELPSREQLAEIARGIATEDGELPEGPELNTVLDASAGLTRLEAENAFSLSLVRHSRITPPAVWELKSQMLKKSGLLTLHRGTESFDELGGLDALKAFCLRAMRRQGHRDPLKRPRGVMLLSPPGCGKSQFAKALGNETNRPTLTLDVGALMGSHVGQTEERTRQALKIADAMAPCILYCDEIEKALSGVSSSGQTDSGVSARLFGSLLGWLNDHTTDVFFIATCNDISKLPPEFARAERFDGVFFVDLPSAEQRQTIWDIYLSMFNLDVEQARPRDENWTGAEIKSACRLAALLDVPLNVAAQNVVPVAVTAAESVERLRIWASGRCLSANDAGIYMHRAGAKRRRKVTGNPRLPLPVVSMVNRGCSGVRISRAMWAFRICVRQIEIFEMREISKMPKSQADDAREDISGDIKNVNQQYGAGVSCRLVGDTSFGWRVGKFTGDLDLNGHNFTMETGGGNRTVFSGVISGKGNFTWNGGGNAQWQTTPSFLTGDRPNTFSGTLTILRGTLALNKPAGVSAVSGARLVLGGGSNQAIIQLGASEQINDTCTVVLTGKHEGRIWTRGHSETLGRLQVQSFGYIDLGDGNSRLSFADSSQTKWDLSKTLTIQNWTSHKDTIRFGTTASGLSRSQLARIGFANPSGRPAGLYAAKLLADGSLVPDRRVEATNPPFNVSDKARVERALVYQVSGRKNLSGKDTPLKDGMRISFFGDSITWQNVYISEIRKALKAGVGTKGLDIALLNHGINGGGVLSIRDGSTQAAYVDQKNRNGKQAAFADVIAADKADVAVVFIGINDVWWRKTSPADFEKALREIVFAAKANRSALVLTTLTVYQEKPDGSNPMDKKCDQYAEITRKVARSTGTPLVDLRRVFRAYLRNHNAELRVDGSLNYVRNGVLTYDGVHPNATGNRLIADHISQGIHDALQTPKRR
eukprot:g10210.t1